MNQFQKNKIIQEGTYFQNLAEDETFRNFIEEIHERITDEWQEEKEPHKRENLWLQMQGLKTIQQEMRLKVQRMEQLLQKE